MELKLAIMPLGRPLYYHLGNAQPYFGILCPPCSQKLLLHLHQPPEQRGALHGRRKLRRAIAGMHHFLTAETAGKALSSPVGAGEGGGYPMAAADHEAMMVELAAACLIKRAHSLRACICGQGLLTQVHILARTLADCFQPRRIKLCQTQP